MKHLLLAGGSLLVLGLAAWGSRFSETSPKGAKQKPLPQHIGAIHPRISPDGEQVAVSYHGAIWRLPRAGGTMTCLTHQDGVDIEPVWSPDGRTIAYVHSTRMFGGDVRLIRADDGAPIPLAVNIVSLDSVLYSKLAFHPDGRLVGKLRVDGKDVGMALVDLQTGAVTSVARPNQLTRFGLSPDGKWMIYTLTRETDGNQWGNDGPQSDVWKVSTAGGEPERLFEFPSRVYDICFSADGKSLFLVSDAGTAHNDLWHVPLSDPARGARRITTGIADEERPSVSADGRWLIFSDNRRGTTSVTVRDLETGDDVTIPISSLDFRRPTGTLRIETVDPGAGKPTTARVSIRQDDGKFVYPPASQHRLLFDNGHFYCDGSTELEVPAGNYSYRAFRGPEYRTAQGGIQVAAGKTSIVKIGLERWTNPAERGWYSGENHIHANYGYGQWYCTPDDMALQCAGEDLRICNFMVANSDTDNVFDREFFRGRPDPASTAENILYWNQEFRSTSWGHMTLVNLHHLVEPIFTGFKDTTNPWDVPTNSDIADRTHLQRGLVNYTHGAQNANDPYLGAYTGKSIPMDVALGKIDTMDLNASYAGTIPLWYRLLNCGFRVSPSAGTDVFLNKISSRLPGADRAYVRIDGDFSYAAWIDGLKAGRSFISSGPMLEFQVDGHGSGDVVQFASPRKVRISGQATSQFPLDKVEVVYNGRVVVQGKLADGQLSGDASAEIEIPKSGWVSLRASGPIHPDHSGGPLEAHAGPVYVEVDGKPAASREDAEYFLQWIDRLSVFLRQRDRVPSLELKQHVERQLEAARSVYLDIAKRAE